MPSKLWWLMFAVAGCGNGSNGLNSLPDASVVTADQACSDYFTTYCMKLNQCAPVLLKLVFGDSATCITRGKLGCMPNFSLPGSSLTPAFVEHCSQIAATLSCSDLTSGKAAPGCEPMAGTLANGTPCSDGSQCMSTFCAKPGGADCGACAAVPAVGSSCANVGCGGRGLACTTTGKVCVTPAAMGASCGPDLPCRSLLSCVPAGGMGTCQAGLPAGATCDPMRQTTAGCDDTMGLACQGKTCKALTLSAPGGICGLASDGTFTFCQASGHCNVPMGSTQGTCQAAAADGAACSQNGPGCLTPAQCTNGICTIPTTTCK